MRPTLLALLAAIAVGCVAPATVPQERLPIEKELADYGCTPIKPDESCTADGAYRMTKGRVDPYANFVALDSPKFHGDPNSENTFTAWITWSKDLGTGEENTDLGVITTRMRVHSFSRAYLLGGRELQVAPMGPADIDCTSFGCIVTQTTVVTMPEEALRSGSGGGLSLKLSGILPLVVEIPGGVIAGFLRRVDEERSGQQKLTGA